MLKPQFAPIEQYAETQSMRQGPWTDLYALAGTCYFMLTGRAPLPATARVITDELVPLASQPLPGCSKRMLEMLDWAMAVRPQDRPQSVAEFREALSGRLHAPGAADIAFDPTAVVPPPGGPGSYDKTMQATMKMTSRTPTPPRAPAPASLPARRPRDDDEPGNIDDKPERSVMLPPKSRSPLKAVLVLAVLAGVVGGAWATRDKWTPMLQGTPLASLLPAPAASAPDSAASAVAGDASASAAAPLAEAASAPAARSSEAVVAANDAAASAAEAAAAPAEPAASTPEEIAADRAARAKAAKAAKAEASRRLEAKLAAIPLPPPVLPPPVGGAAAAANTTAAATPAAATAKPATEAAPSGEAGAGPVSNLRSLGGPRELCKDGEPAQVAACVKQLCDNDARYRRYPVCLRIHKKEAAQE